MVDYADDLRLTVTRAAAALLEIPEEVAGRRPAGPAAPAGSPGKWSAKEIVGHLIDSASNNHQRFVRAQFQDDLIFPGYEQDAWVAAQHYQDAAWRDLVALWRDYNVHLARVMELVPAEIRLRERSRHNLHHLAWQPVPADRPATLDYFMRDYVGHLRHHLAQIRALVGETSVL